MHQCGKDAYLTFWEAWERQVTMNVNLITPPIDVYGAYVICLKWSLILQGSMGKLLHPDRIFLTLQCLAKKCGITFEQLLSCHSQPQFRAMETLRSAWLREVVSSILPQNLILKMFLAAQEGLQNWYKSIFSPYNMHARSNIFLW